MTLAALSSSHLLSGSTAHVDHFTNGSSEAFAAEDLVGASVQHELLLGNDALAGGDSLGASALDQLAFHQLADAATLAHNMAVDLEETTSVDLAALLADALAAVDRFATLTDCEGKWMKHYRMHRNMKNLQYLLIGFLIDTML